MTRATLSDWIAGYERAWRTVGTAALAALFAPDASYRAAPFEEPLVGLEAIARFWEAERDGPGEGFELEAGVVAVEGEVGVARLEVRYAGPPPRTYRDLWIVAFDEAGRCRAFEEWPFFPDRPRVDAA